MSRFSMYGAFILARDVVRKHPRVRNVLWRMRRSYRHIQRLRYVRRPVLDAGPLLSNAIMEVRPFAAGKIGVCEMDGLLWYLKRLDRSQRNKDTTPYPRYVRETLYTNAGVFPKDDESFDRFGGVFLDSIRALDAVVAWDLKGEGAVFRDHCTNASLITLRSLEPFNACVDGTATGDTPPWSAALEGKKVLVVSPFGGSISSQYSRRTEIWDDRRILPEFELRTVIPPLSAGIVPPESRSWSEALAKLKNHMANVEFDVALIGAGAFSLPLAAHAKSLGRVGVHLGGGTQIMFGVVGKRWEMLDRFSRFVSRQSWVRPSKTETPVMAGKVEDGCYW